MYIVPLNLPKIPDELYAECTKFIKDIDVDRKLDYINHYRQSMNKAAPLSSTANNWINNNVFFPNFTAEQLAQGKIIRPYNNLINITTYFNDGSHPAHTDVGRNYALNYYFDTGGSNTTIRWHDDANTTVIYESDTIVTNQWYLLKVRPELHSVVGIEPNGIRTFLTLNIATEHLEAFNETDFFKTLLSR